MEIRKAHINDMDQIIALNKVVDYGNPDDFFKESINLGRVLVACDNDFVI